MLSRSEPKSLDDQWLTEGKQEQSYIYARPIQAEQRQLNMVRIPPPGSEGARIIKTYGIAAGPARKSAPATPCLPPCSLTPVHRPQLHGAPSRNAADLSCLSRRCTEHRRDWPPSGSRGRLHTRGACARGSRPRARVRVARRSRGDPGSAYDLVGPPQTEAHRLQGRAAAVATHKDDRQARTSPCHAHRLLIEEEGKLCPPRDARWAHTPPTPNASHLDLDAGAPMGLPSDNEHVVDRHGK